MPHAGEIYWIYVETVLERLRKCASREETLSVIRQIRASLVEFESSLQNADKSVDKVLTQPGAAGSDGNGAAPVLNKWLEAVGPWGHRECSIAREMEILRVLEERGTAVMLRHLHERMIVLGLSELGGQAALVTQISRMKKLGAIARQAQGHYIRTDAGLVRLQKMRTAHRDLWVPDDVRASVS